MKIDTLPNAPGLLVITHPETECFYVTAAVDLYESARTIKSALTMGSYHNAQLKALPGVPDSLDVTYTETPTHDQAKLAREQFVKRYYGDIRLLNKTHLPIMPGTYVLTHLESGQYYIGYTRDVRFTQSHQLTLLRTKRHKNKTLQALYDKNPDPKVFGYSFTVTKDKVAAKELLEEMLTRCKDDPLLLNEKKTRKSKHDVGAYRIVHQPTGHYYIGSAKQLQRRWGHHKWQLKNGRHKNHRFQALYTGDLNDFTIDIEYTDDRQTAYRIEQQWLDEARHDPKCLNMATDARSAINSIDMTDEARQRGIDKSTAVFRTPEYREFSSKRSKAYWSDPANLEKRKGAGNPFAKVLVIGDFVYGSVKDAMREIGIYEKTLRKYARNAAYKGIYFPADHYRKVDHTSHTPWEDTDAVKRLIDILNTLSYGRPPVALDGTIYATVAAAQQTTGLDFYVIKHKAVGLPVFCLTHEARFVYTNTLSSVTEITYPPLTETDL